MMEIVFLLEERSAKALIEIILDRMNSPCPVRYIVFEGKQDIDKQITQKLRGYNNNQAYFIILRDQDSSDCLLLKKNLLNKCQEVNRSKAVIRIACHELESWYLADLNALAQAFKDASLLKLKTKSRFQNPDAIVNPADELKKIIPEYQKISGTRQIAPYLDLTNRRSNSFFKFISTIEKIVQQT